MNPPTAPGSAPRAAHCGLLALILVAAAAARLPGVFVRSTWYDETITLLETSAGRTDWPEVPTGASELRRAFQGTPTLREVTDRLRVTDVHPPIYYWKLTVWRALFGRSVETARLLSLLYSVAAVGVFWWVLRVAGLENPAIPTFVFALSKYAVHYGHEARGYALAVLLLLLGILASLVSLQRPPGNGRGASVPAALASVFLAGSFLTSYLMMFVIAVTLVWLLAVSNRETRGRACLTVTVTPVLAAGGLLVLRLQDQFGARPDQEAGFRGFLWEAQAIAVGFVRVVCRIPAGVSWLLVAALLAALAALTIWVVRTKGPASPWERRIVALSAALVAGQAAGVYLTDSILDKHLVTARYLLAAGPALAVLVGVGATRIAGRARFAARGLLLIVAALLVAGVNLTEADCRTGKSFGPYRPIARQLGREAEKPVLAVVGAGFGRGDLWSWVYELPAETAVLFVGWDDDGSGVLAHVGEFREVWILGASDGGTRRSETALRDRLVAAGWRVLARTSWEGAVRLGRGGPARDGAPLDPGGSPLALSAGPFP